MYCHPLVVGCDMAANPSSPLFQSFGNRKYSISLHGFYHRNAVPRTEACDTVHTINATGMSVRLHSHFNTEKKTFTDIPRF